MNLRLQQLLVFELQLADHFLQIRDLSRLETKLRWNGTWVESSPERGTFPDS